MPEPDNLPPLRDVIGRGAHDRQAQGNIHTIPEAQGLDRDQRLVVVHAQYRIISLARFLMEQRVGGKRPPDSKAARLQRCHGGRDDGAIFAAQHTIFTGMGV